MTVLFAIADILQGKSSERCNGMWKTCGIYSLHSEFAMVIINDITLLSPFHVHVA